MSRGSFARAVVLIAVVALALRIAYVLALGAHPPLGKDGTWYALQAGAIGEGVGYVDPARYFGLRGTTATAQFPPLWPTFLALVYTLGFGTLRAYRIVGGFFGVATLVMTAYIGRQVVDARVGLVAASVVALSPFMIAADGSLMAESMFLALVTGAVLVALRARSSPKLGWFALLGLLLGLATLTRADGIIVTVVLVGVTAWCVPAAVGRRLACAAIALAVVVAAFIPWTLRNDAALHEPVVLSSNSGSLLAGANCKAAYNGRDIAGWSANCAAALERDGQTELERAADQREAGLTYAREHAGRLALVLPLRVVRGWGLWNPSALADAEVIESRNRPMQMIGWPVELAVLALATAGGVLLVRRKAPIAPLLAVIAAATIILASSWGNQRFRLVAEPELVVLAAAALVTAWTRVRSNSTSSTRERAAPEVTTT